MSAPNNVQRNPSPVTVVLKRAPSTWDGTVLSPSRACAGVNACHMVVGDLLRVGASIAKTGRRSELDVFDVLGRFSYRVTLRRQGRQSARKVECAAD